MNNVAKHARRILASKQRDAPDVDVFPGYISFEDEARPRWWRADIAEAEWGRVLGVHENEPETSVGAIAVTELGLALLDGSGGKTWLPYSNIVECDQLSKEPISRALIVRIRSGQAVALPFPGAGAFGFVQFLNRAIFEIKRSGSGP